MKGFICASWGTFNGVEGKGRSGVIKDRDVKDLFDQLAASEFKGFVDPDQAGFIRGSNATLVVLDAQGKVVHVFNEKPFEGGLKEAWEKLGLLPTQFPEKTAYTFPGVKETAPSKGPGPAGGDYTFLARSSGPAFRLFIDPGDRVKLVVESRAVGPEQKGALSWSSEPRAVEPGLFRNLFDTINPGGVARAADVVLPWKEVAGSLTYRPAGSEGKFRYAVIAGPIRMTKKDVTAAGPVCNVMVGCEDSTAGMAANELQLTTSARSGSWRAAGLAGPRGAPHGRVVQFKTGGPFSRAGRWSSPVAAG